MNKFEHLLFCSKENKSNPVILEVFLFTFSCGLISCGIRGYRSDYCVLKLNFPLALNKSSLRYGKLVLVWLFVSWYQNIRYGVFFLFCYSANTWITEVQSTTETGNINKNALTGRRARANLKLVI